MEHQLCVRGKDHSGSMCPNDKNSPAYGKYDDYKECPVCEWSASVCKVCGAVECELMDIPECPGHKKWRKQY